MLEKIQHLPSQATHFRYFRYLPLQYRRTMVSMEKAELFYDKAFFNLIRLLSDFMFFKTH